MASGRADVHAADQLSAAIRRLMSGFEWKSYGEARRAKEQWQMRRRFDGKAAVSADVAIRPMLISGDHDSGVCGARACERAS